MDDHNLTTWIPLIATLAPFVIMFFVMRRIRQSLMLPGFSLITRLIPRPVAFFVLLGFSLFTGLMVATAGGAVYPPLLQPGASLVCDGQVETVSQHYSYKPGQTGISRTLVCHESDKAPRTITLDSIGVSTLIYAAVTFILIWLLRLLRGKGRRDDDQSGTVEDGNTSSTTAPGATPVDPQAALLQSVAQLLQARAAGKLQDSHINIVDREKVKSFFDVSTSTQVLSTDDHARTPAARMKLLDELLAQKLISQEEYDHKRAEILDAL